MIATHVTPHSLSELSRACLDVLSGRDVGKLFEEKVRQHLNSENFVTTSSGRRALYLALKALSLKKGDEVIVPAFTIDLIPMILRKMGLVPVTVDARLDDYNMDSSLIPDVISKKTKAVVAVHTFGCPSDLKSLRQICDDHGLFLVENAASAFGAEYAGKPVGTFGDVGVLSFGFGKSISMGGAGGLVFNDLELFKKIKLDTSGKHKGSIQTFVETFGSIILANPVLYSMFGYKVKKRRVSTQYDCFDSEIPDDSSPSRLSYALGLNQIESRKYEDKRRIALKYSGFLENMDGVETQKEGKNVRSVYSRYFVRAESKKMRDNCINEMIGLGIEPSIPIA
ncbi:MAG: aminotransferase class I/II-fold pyridoxal phosphate-dependent enzyme, partial [Candidatus Altiarchaeota archaeon]